MILAYLRATSCSRSRRQVDTDLVVLEVRSTWSAVVLEDTPRRWGWVPTEVLKPSTSDRSVAQKT